MSDPSFLSNKLFTGIPAERLVNLMPVPLVVDQDEVIFHEGDPAECIYLIDSGTIRISKVGRGGRQETLAFLEGGDFFGEMGLYGQATRSAQATAAGHAVLGCVDRSAFQELIKRAPEIVTNLLVSSVSRLRETDAHFIREMLEAERLSLLGTMLSSIAHDLRDPLNRIRNVAELLAEDLDDQRRARFTSMLNRNVELIADMVQELLDYSEGATDLFLEPVRLGDLIGKLEEDVLLPLTDNGFRVTIGVRYGEPVLLDRQRMFRALLNIVKNAKEAMPDGGSLELEVEESTGGVVIKIRDTGKGIPPDILPTIFEPFVTHGKPNGTGLGMAIVKSVVEAHRGRIQVESTPGLGTCFTIWLPATHR